MFSFRCLSQGRLSWIVALVKRIADKPDKYYKSNIDGEVLFLS